MCGFIGYTSLRPLLPPIDLQAGAPGHQRQGHQAVQRLRRQHDELAGRTIAEHSTGRQEVAHCFLLQSTEGPGGSRGPAQVLRHSSLVKGCDRIHHSHQGEDHEWDGLPSRLAHEVLAAQEGEVGTETSGERGGAGKQQPEGTPALASFTLGQDRVRDPRAVRSTPLHGRHESSSQERAGRREGGSIQEGFPSTGASHETSNPPAKLPANGHVQKFQRQDDDPRLCDQVSHADRLELVGMGLLGEAAVGGNTHHISPTRSGVEAGVERSRRNLDSSASNPSLSRRTQLVRQTDLTADGQRSSRAICEPHGSEVTGDQRSAHGASSVSAIKKADGDRVVDARSRNHGGLVQQTRSIEARVDMGGKHGPGLVCDSLREATQPAGPGATGNGPVRYPPQPQGTELRQPSPQSRRDVGELHSTPVVGTAAISSPNPLRIPTSISTTANYTEGGGGETNSTVGATSHTRDTARATSTGNGVPPSDRPMDRQHSGNTTGRHDDAEAEGVQPGALDPGFRRHLRLALGDRALQDDVFDVLLKQVLGSKPSVTLRVWSQYHDFCKSHRLEPIPTSILHAQSTIERYLIFIQGQKNANGKLTSESVFNQHRSTLSRLFASARRMNVNSFVVRKVGKQISSNPATASSPKYDASYHNGMVFHHHACQVAAAYAPRSSSSNEEKLAAVEKALLHALRADTVSRGADLVGIWCRSECIRGFDKRGHDVGIITGDPSDPGKHTVDWSAVDKADTLELQAYDCKTTKGKLCPVVTIRRVRWHRVLSAKFTDTLFLLELYGYLTEEARGNTHPDDQGLFINKALCTLRPTTKFRGTDAETVVAPPCGGRCGFIHRMAPATLNKLCKEALKDAGVDTQKYTSHAIRGNVECAMIAASHDSKLYKASEGIRRARHTQETHERNYKRPAHP